LLLPLLFFCRHQEEPSGGSPQKSRTGFKDLLGTDDAEGYKLKDTTIIFVLLDLGTFVIVSMSINFHLHSFLCYVA